MAGEHDLVAEGYRRLLRQLDGIRYGSAVLQVLVHDGRPSRIVVSREESMQPEPGGER
jgi:hypothetical protein